jgi:hypothetical protein
MAETSVLAPVETGAESKRPGGEDNGGDAAVLGEAGEPLEGRNPTSVTRGDLGKERSGANRRGREKRRGRNEAAQARPRTVDASI